MKVSQPTQSLSGAQKLHIFSKVSKIREAIYGTEGVCSETAYKDWRNTLYTAGYADSIVHKEEQRLLTLGELEAAGQFFWGNV